MTLDKWYLDAVFPDGSAWYGYRALIRFGYFPPVHFASSHSVSASGKGTEITRWPEIREPACDGNSWEWIAPGGFRGHWQPVRSRGEELELSRDSDLKIHWSCLAPDARFDRLDPGKKEPGGASGSGYIERLQVQSGRRALPFRSLRWGHANAGDASLVWIQWARGKDLSLILENGVQVPGSIEEMPDGGVKVQTASSCWETLPGKTICDRDVRKSFSWMLVWLARGLAPSREMKILGNVRRKCGAQTWMGSGIWEHVLWR